MNTPCLVSLVTPKGRGAVATLAVFGPDALRCVAGRFRSGSGRTPAEMPRDRILFGRWRTAKGLGEELVICRRRQWIEVHCHGGQAAPQAVLASLVADGCREIPWTEMARHMGGDEIAVEARIALAQARTERTAAILLDQLRGALRAEWNGIASVLEAGHREQALVRLRNLLQREPLGRHLIEPFRVVFYGLPNVGKSSLINAILGYERAIVFDQPGTTRDVVTGMTALEGWPVELADTAGFRPHDDPLESASMQLAFERLASADLIILVRDATKPSNEWEWLVPRPVAEELVVDNKCDLGRRLDSTAPIATSAATGEGIDALIRSIRLRLVPHPPQPGEPVPFTERQFQLLRCVISEVLPGQGQQAVARLRARD